MDQEPALRSLRLSSFSTASRMKPARFSPSSSTASMRSSVPSGKRAGVCSWLICGRPRDMGQIIDDITKCYKSYFSRYHLLHSSELMISSNHQQRSKQMFSLESAGINAFDLRTRRGAFCGLVVQTKTGDWRAFFNMTATKGSQRRFPTIEAAVKFIHDRRAKKGWGV